MYSPEDQDKWAVNLMQHVTHNKLAWQQVTEVPWYRTIREPSSELTCHIYGRTLEERRHDRACVREHRWV